MGSSIETRREYEEDKRNNTLFAKKTEARLKEHQDELEDMKRIYTLYEENTTKRFAEYQNALANLRGWKQDTVGCIQRVEGVETLNKILLFGMGGSLILFVVGALYYMKKKMNSYTSDVNQLTNETTQLRRDVHETHAQAWQSANILEHRINRIDTEFPFLRDQSVRDSEGHQYTVDATGQAHLPEGMQLISFLPPV